MEFWDFASLATVFGCITGVVITVVDKAFGSLNTVSEDELALARERADQQERRIAELTRQKEQLHEQLEWHFRLLEAQGARPRPADRERRRRTRPIAADAGASVAGV